jgi:hypothetical protein
MWIVNITTFIATIYLKGYNKKKLRLVSILAFYSSKWSVKIFTFIA